MSKLNNLLDFKNFSSLNNEKLKKATKRTEIGGDVLNENIYDKVRLAVEQDRDYKPLIDKLKSNILNMCKAGQVNGVDVAGNKISFTINKRKFAVDKSKNTILLYGKEYEKYKENNKTKSKQVGEKEVKVSVDKDVAEKIFSAIEKCK